MKEFQVSYVTEELMQVFEHADLRRKKSEKMGRREAAKEKKDVDKEAEEFIKFEHSKFYGPTYFSKDSKNHSIDDTWLQKNDVAEEKIQKQRKLNVGIFLKSKIIARPWAGP
ncbi:hypothetical protein YC2023_090008 [Brassica napus]